MDNNNINNIEDKIKLVITLRENNRLNLIKEIAFNLHNYLKENGFIIVERDFLKTFFNEIKNLTTQNKILKDVITYLISNNKLSITEKYKNRIRFMRKSLFSFQDSYAEILKKGCCISNNNKSIVKCNSKYKVMAYKVL